MQAVQYGVLFQIDDRAVDIPHSGEPLVMGFVHMGREWQNLI